MTKKKVLIAYGGMVVGGSTTALLSMLKEWNFEKYDVDLILYDRGFPFEKDKEINHFVVSILFSVPLSDCVFPACKGS